MAKLTVADLVPKDKVFVAKGTRKGEPFEIDVPFKTVDSAAEMFECYALLGQENGVIEVMAKLTGLTPGECVYLFVSIDNRDDLSQVVRDVLGIDGEPDPTTEASSE